MITLTMQRGKRVSETVSGKSKILLKTLRRFLEFIFSTVGYCRRTLLGSAAH